MTETAVILRARGMRKLTKAARCREDRSSPACGALLVSDWNMRASKRKFRVATGLIAIWLVLTVTLQLWQIWASQRDERALALQQTEHRAGQLAVAVAEHIAVFTRAVDFVLLELRREYGMQDPHFRETVALLLKSFPEGTILQFGVADANGDLTYSNLGLTQAVNVRDREHFTAHLDGG
ncbi:MAG: hypothetical protein AAB654_24765, partial [Acidobacteriota bacterium]